MPALNRSRLMSVARAGRLIGLSLIVFGVYRFLSWPDRPFEVQFEPEDNLQTVARVVDGDTLTLTNGDRVRLIGVDTPEFSNGRAEPFAVEATEFTKRMVAGRTVRLEFDKERFDKYRRVLAFVYVDDVLLNEELARAGLARVLTQYGYSSKMKKRLLKAEQEAQRQQLNLWKSR